MIEPSEYTWDHEKGWIRYEKSIDRITISDRDTSVYVDGDKLDYLRDVFMTISIKKERTD